MTSSNQPNSKYEQLWVGVYSILIGLGSSIALLFILTISTKAVEKWDEIIVPYISSLRQQVADWSTNTFLENGKDILIDTTSQLISKIGTPMTKDQNGNINALLVGYGGKGHDGGLLSDSIIVASFNPDSHSVAMVSIPRDLFVATSTHSVGKINSILPNAYSKHNKDITKAIPVLQSKITEITGIELPYYVLVDFDGFANLVNTIGGIDIHIPYSIYDRTYPGPRWTYTTFSIQSGYQHLDGATALKYARSRHTTSDMSRSQRQQLIIQGILSKLQEKGISVSTLQEMYGLYTQHVTTNITLDEMLGLLEYGTTIPSILQFGYTYECSTTNWKYMKPGCFLYTTLKDDFNGLAGMLPFGANKSRISNYTTTQSFAQFVSTHQETLKTPYTLHIYNTMDRNYAKQFAYRSNLHQLIAVKMKRYGLTVVDVGDHSKDVSHTGTLVQIQGYDDTTALISTLKEFFPIETIEHQPIQYDGSGNALPPRIDIYLGNDVLDQYGHQKFNPYITTTDNAQ